MAKVRVYELAKELGVESKTVLSKLTELGEFVRSASSTIEAPVARRLRDAFPKTEANAEKPATASTKKTSKPVASATSAESKPAAAEVASEKPATQLAKPAPSKPKAESSPETTVQIDAVEPKATTEKSGARTEVTSGSTPPASGAATNKPGMPRPQAKPGAPRPGNNPFGSPQGMQQKSANGPRPGNNPFASAQGMPRPGGKPRKEQDATRNSERTPRTGGRPAPTGGRPGSGRPTEGGSNRSGGPRPNPGMVAPRSAVKPGSERPGGAGSSTGNNTPRSGRPAGGGFTANKPQGAGNAPNPAGASNSGGGPGFGGRPGGGRGAGGRGSTQGAFGRAGGKPAKGRKSKRAKRQEFEQMQAPSLGGVQVPRGDGSTVIRLRRGASLSDFADKIDANPASLVTVLFHLGEMATATQSLDEDTFGTLGAELGYVVEMVSAEDEDRELLEGFDIDLEAEEAAEGPDKLTPRPPVVTVMGHVDHGKTRLLDAIRKTDVISGEAGGITQHIGAYQVRVNHDGEARALTFIDTPGHEAFTAMRARGAQVTDIAILVVAADDGVMPQTIEALNHAQAANVPIVVAVNKVDKDTANPSKIRQQLTEYNLVAEEYGGDTLFVDVSAKQNQGIDQLLEAVLLTADAALHLQANASKDARGVAIEANLDKGRGAVATVLVQSGTLNVGDSIVAGTAYGRVRAMFDEHGTPVAAAGPARPVQVLGLTSVPRAGDTFLVAQDDRTARQIAEKRQAAERAATLAKRRKRISLEDFTQALEQGKVETLNLVLKGDVSGAVEALEDALLKIDVGEEVALRIIHRGVGAITQNDVNLATVDNAIIIGFNVKPAERVGEMADREGVDIRHYTVIYQAIDDVEAALKGMLKPEYEEFKIGFAEIRQIFRSAKVGNIAGCMVKGGEIRRNTKVRVLRNGQAIGENLTVESLKRVKDDVNEVREGFECGISLAGFNDIQEGDIIEAYEMREIPRS